MLFFAFVEIRQVIGEREMNALLFGTDSRAAPLVAASPRTLP